ncbi:DUF3307 domain-containing protein [Actinomadura sp. 9N215]|uniref:DUF3307 domain-containing protein n=1 Tax=Actinomadura sp. 9N215 TaxID=3375150 RepID=UPI0037938963
MVHAITFAVVFATLYAAHHVGDHWVQTYRQVIGKARPDWSGRLACVRHVITMTITKIAMLALAVAVLDIRLSVKLTALALTIDAISHYWADRRTTLAKLAAIINKSEYFAFGSPRPDRDDNPTAGTGAFHLDQSFHIVFIWVTALIIAL